MGAKQAEFVKKFRERFQRRFGCHPEWGGGQGLDNKAGFAQLREYRRDGLLRKNEGIELGDTNTTFRGVTVIVEYDSDGLDIQNLLKYWPYLCGKLTSSPPRKVVLCHFSSWRSYGSRRDEWTWLRDKMAADPDRVMDLVGEQFDNGGLEEGGLDETILSRNLDLLLNFIDQNAVL
jgi:hypothetical protein